MSVRFHFRPGAIAVLPVLDEGTEIDSLIDQEADHFPPDTRARFRAACSRVVTLARTSEAPPPYTQEAAPLVYKAIAVLAKSRNLDADLDALRLVIAAGRQHGALTELAVKHGISVQAMRKHVIRVGRLVGLPYRARKYAARRPHV